MSRNYFQEWTRRYPITEFWHDSAEPAEIRRAVSWGAVSVTQNPILIPRAARSSTARWDVEIAALSKADWSAADIAWALTRGIALENAAILAPIYERTGGKAGRICVQVDPTKHDEAATMIEQGAAISRWAKNILIKIPVTAAGLVAIEHLAAQGVSTVGTVSYSVPQVVGIAEAFRRGLARARQNGVDTSLTQCHAVIMTGRLDDHLRDVMRESKIAIAEAAINCAGVLVTQKAWRIFQERDYRCVLLLASFRAYHDLGDFIGGRYSVSVPIDVEDKVIAQGLPLKAGIAERVPDAVTQELLAKMPDFARAYHEDGMQPEEFANFGPAAKTLKQFIAGYQDLQAFVREQLDKLG
jgi:transaldolase